MDVLDVGCGRKKDPVATVGMDAFALPGVDVVHDVLDFPWPFPDGSFDRLVSHQLIEHIPPGRAGQDPLLEFFDEAWRVLRPGGTFAFDTPHADSWYAYGDLTHRRYFVPYAFHVLWEFDPNSPYPRKMWARESVRCDYTYRFAYHVKKHLPSLDRVLQRHRHGTPEFIYIVLRKP